MAFSSAHQLKILLVDDNADLLRLLQTGLLRAGYEVVTAKDGEEGLRRASSEQLDLIVIDIEMPKMDGYNMLRRLRKEELLKETPVIVLTGYGPMKDMFEGLGVSDFFVKSGGIRGFMEAVAKNLKSDRKTQTAEAEGTEPRR